MTENIEVIISTHMSCHITMIRMDPMTGKALSWTKSSCQISDIFDDALSLTEVSCCGSGNNYAYCFTQTKDSPSTKRAGGSHSIEGLILAKTSKISQKFHS